MIGNIFIFKPSRVKTYFHPSNGFTEMGGAVSKIRKISLEERVNYLKKTPFSLYLKDGTLKEFAMCFPYFMECKGGEILVLDENIYLVAKGEVTLSTTMADSTSKIENKGYLCKKDPGDLFSLTREQEIAVEKVRICVHLLFKYLCDQWLMTITWLFSLVAISVSKEKKTTAVCGAS